MPLYKINKSLNKIIRNVPHFGATWIPSSKLSLTKNNSFQRKNLNVARMLELCWFG